MVNKRAKYAAEKKEEARQESREFGRRMKYKRTFVTNKNKVLNCTMMMPLDWFGRFYLHEFAGKKPLKYPCFCDKDQYDQKKCDLCGLDGTWGDTYSTLYRVGMVCVHDWVGKKFKDDNGKKHDIPPLRFFLFNKGRDNRNWDFMDDLDAEGKFQTAVFQIQKRKKGYVLKRLTKEQRLKLPTKGKVPEAVREEVGEWDENTFWNHMLNLFKNNEPAFDLFDIEEIEMDDSEADEDDADDNYPDEDDRKKKKKKKKVTSKKRRRDEDEDEDDDEEDEEEEAEEDDEEDDESDDAEEDDEEDDPPVQSKHRAKSKPVRPAKKKPSKKRHQEEDDEDEDDGYDMEEEEDDPPKKKKKKVSSGHRKTTRSSKRLRS